MWARFCRTAAVAGLLACGGPEEPFAPPPELDGGWRLESFESVPAQSVPAGVASRNVESALRAVYRRGTETAAVELFRMQAASSAFELVQQWRPVESKVAAYRGRWFFTVECPGAGNEALSALAGALEQSLPPS